MNIDSTIDKIFEPVSNLANSVVFYDVNIAGYDIKLILVWLVTASVFFTCYLGFINVRFFAHAFKLMIDEFKAGPEGAEPGAKGQISRFEALTTSLSGTVGLGNIAGVAVAVSIGGPGAVFWMLVAAFFSMTTKFTEITMAIKYRKYLHPDQPSRVSGGPMYYIDNAFEKIGWQKIGVVIAYIFAILCVGASIGGGNMFQANQAYQQAFTIAGGEGGLLDGRGWMFGVALSAIVAAVILGGINSIASVASRLVPLMALIYVLAGLLIIGLNIGALPGALATIFVEAFKPAAGIGGMVGALLVGIQRAAFSNEAGLGSAAIVHAAVKTKDHVSQGMVGMLGPFFDTVIICMVTALMIVITGAYLDGSGVEGVALTSRAMETGGSWLPYVLALVVTLFAFSTLISWFYYGLKAIKFLFGEGKIVDITFKLFYCFCVVIGASANLANIISFSDAMMLSLAFPNILALYLFAPEIKADVQKYIQGLKNNS